MPAWTKENKTYAEEEINVTESTWIATNIQQMKHLHETLFAGGTLAAKNQTGNTEDRCGKRVRREAQKTAAKDTVTAGGDNCKAG